MDNCQVYYSLESNVYCSSSVIPIVLLQNHVSKRKTKPYKFGRKSMNLKYNFNFVETHPV